MPTSPPLLEHLKSRKPLLIHIPKTGGTTCRITMGNHGHSHLLHPHGMGHYSVSDRTRGSFPCFDALPEYLADNKMFLMTVVRNPFDLLASWYSHGTDGWGHSARGCANFTEYVHRFVNNQINYRSFCVDMFGQLFTADGTYAPEVTLRTEHLAKGLTHVLRSCGLLAEGEALKLHARNYSPSREKRHYNTFYTQETQALIEDKCAEILRRFEYTFEGPLDDKPIKGPIE